MGLGFGFGRRRRGLDWWCSSSSSDVEEEGAGAVLMEPGSSMRKETDSRISARVAGFLGAAVRRAGGGGRMFALSGMESWRGRFRLPREGSGRVGCC